MSLEPPVSPAEFRPYRRFLSALVLTFVSVGSFYLLTSVGVTIYRRSHAQPIGGPAGASAADLQSCADELSDIEQALERHLDTFDHLVEHYDTDEAQRWSEDRALWDGQWQASGRRCRYSDPRPGPLAKEWEQLAVIFGELHETEQKYDKELIRFGTTEAPRLDRIRDRLEAIRER